MIETTLSDNDIELLKRYNKPGPRYTSYPTAPEWQNDFSHKDYVKQLTILDKKRDTDSLSLYFHVPFCEERCLYCGCHVIIDKNRIYVDKYLDYLEKELAIFSQNMTGPCKVSQLHWGGGTPTYLNEAEIERLYNSITRYFSIEEDAEVAIEIDPCVTSKSQIKVLRDLGFNRISMGVQDFNVAVQEAVHRVQSLELTTGLIDYARSIGFTSVNLDFIYGLPLQTVESFNETIHKLMDISPDRIALFSYAKVPWLKPHQKRMNEEDIPDVDEKFAIFLSARKLLTEEGGYTAIGMDHFAKDQDEITVALNNKTLHRNFMGYTVQSTKHYIGFGVSSIGYVQQSFIQNVKTLKDYYNALDNNELPVDRGISLNDDDLIRQWVIYSLMCHFEVDYQKFEDCFQISFTDYFSEEMNELYPFVEDDLIEVTKDQISVKEKGTLFIRNIAMLFDKYLKSKLEERRFSQTI